MFGFAAFLRFSVFRMGKSNPKVMFLQNVENRNPVLADRFYAGIGTVTSGKPVIQLIQPFCKERKEGLLLKILNGNKIIS